MTDPARRRSRNRMLALTLAAMGIVVSLIALLSVELHRSYRRELDGAGAVAGALARTLEQQLLASMDRIDLLEQEAAFQYAAHRQGTGLAGGQMNGLLARHLARVPGLLSLRLINERGDYVFDASGAVSPANIADRRYFRVQQESAEAGLFPEGPLFSRVVSQWTLTFSRGVRGSDGRFLGIVQSSVQTDALAVAFQSVSLGSGDNITLLNGDGALVARHPNLPELIGKPAISDTLRGLLASKVAEAVYSGRSAADGSLRVYALRRIGGYPFYVLVGIGQDRVLAEWRRTAAVYVLVAVVLLLGSIWLAVRAVRRFSATVRQAEELQRLTSGVFANALEGIIVTDGDSRIITANQAMCAMTGYGLDELIGQTPALFRSDVHDDAFFSAFWDHLRTNGRWQGEIWNRRKSGEVVPELLSVSAISEGGVGGSAYIGVYTDISAAKAAQRKMEFSYAELSRLAEVMAHHLQEPSRLLVTFAQRLRKSEDARALGPESIASLEFIEQQAGRLRALIRDIQLYLAAAQPTPEPEPCPLAQAIRNVVSRRAGLLAAIGAEVVVPGELPAVAVDGRRLHELFDILLDNAIRYRRGEVPLRVEVAAAAKDGMVEVRFSDNGPGIEPRYRELVFRVFERLDHGPGEEGTGIGLAIVRRIVEHGNGSVWIEDTVGGGTTVVLDLPMGRPA